MPKVSVVFADTDKEDKEGNPLVDIATVSKPQFPDDEKDYSPAQKSAIQFLSRIGQPEWQQFLCKLNAEAILLQSQFEEIQANITEENCGTLPLDVALIHQRTKDIRGMIEETIGTFN